MNRIVPADIQVVTFDLDDTLWHCAPAIQKAEVALFEWHERVTPEVIRAHTPESLHEFRQRVRQEHPELQGCVTAMRLAGLRKLLDEFDYPQALAEEGFTVFYKARSEVELYDGAVEMLSQLKQQYQLAAITNGNADLQAIGIADFFDAIYAADLQQPAKPAPDMFQQCSKDLNAPTRAILHIGDNPITDVTGGHSAGVQTLWFNQYNEVWPEHLPAPHYEVQTLPEILSLLRTGSSPTDPSLAKS